MFSVSLNVACAVVSTYAHGHMHMYSSHAYGIVAAVPSLLFLSCCLFRPTYIRTYMCMYVCGYQHDM